jgi:hypothetical protein
MWRLVMMTLPLMAESMVWIAQCEMLEEYMETPSITAFSYYKTPQPSDAHVNETEQKKMLSGLNCE